MDSHEQNQSRSVHHPARNRRHLRGRDLDPLDRHRGRDGDPGKGRQRLRRRRRHRVHAAGGRAASQRPRRRRADHRARHKTRPHRGDLRPGSGAGRRDHRALHERGAGDGARHRAVWRPAFPARSNPGCCCCATTARCGCATCSSPRSPMPATAIRWWSALRATIETVEQMFRKHWTTSAAVYLPDNEVPKPGTLFTNKTLAETYARILTRSRERRQRPRRADRARAQNLVARLCRGSDRQFLPYARDHGRQRLAASRRAPRRRHGALAATVEAPLTYDYGRYTVCKAGVWSQGPVMLQQLALLKGFELDGLDPAGPEFIHLQVECAKLAFADREKFYGDPNFSEIPITTLLSDAYNDERRKLISDKASLDFIPGSVEGFGAVVKLRRARGPSRGGRRHGRGRADRRPLRRGARRHRAFRHHRPGRQHDLGDAVRRLAAIIAGDPGTRLLPRQPRADVLAGGKPSRIAGAGQTPAHHAVADHGAARRRAVSGLGLARRRPAGSMDHAVLSAARPCQN